jgi:hypothetical protein
MATVHPSVTRVTTDRSQPAPIPKVYTRTIDGVARPMTVPEPQPAVFVTTSTSRVHTDN